MFKKNKTVSLDVSLITPIGGKGRPKDMYGTGQFDLPNIYESRGRMRRISGTRSPMRLSLNTGSNVDLRAG